MQKMYNRIEQDSESEKIDRVLVQVLANWPIQSISASVPSSLAWRRRLHELLQQLHQLLNELDEQFH
jgi:hypothetical protein